MEKRENEYFKSAITMPICKLYALRRIYSHLENRHF